MEPPRLLKSLISRRQFMFLAFALASLKDYVSADDDSDLFAACESVMKTVSGRVLDDLWDEHGGETTIDPDDIKDLHDVFELFVKDGAAKSEFLFTKNFVSKPTSSNGIDFVLPYADESGLPLDVLLRHRIAAQPAPRLVTITGEKRTDYLEPVPHIEFPKPAAALNIVFDYSGSEDLKAETLSTPIGDNKGIAQISISTGFIRRVMQSCIYANPVICDSRTLLWRNLKLMPGTSDSILVESEAGPTSISLLPLLCAVDSGVYNFNADQQHIVAVMGSFHRVFKAFMTLRSGEKLGRDVDIKNLRNDIDILAGISELFFLTVTFIVTHEVAHAVYLHTVANDDQKRNHEQELIADQAATLHLFLTALTDSLDKAHTWTEYWKYSLVGSTTLERRLLWFERLFGFGVATNIALEVLGNRADSTHPEKEERWARNVRVWNNCAVAFSNVTTLAHSDHARKSVH